MPYRIAGKNGIKRVNIIHCVCEYEKETPRRLWVRKKDEGICIEAWRNKAHDCLETDKARHEELRIIKIDTSEVCFVSSPKS